MEIETHCSKISGTRQKQFYKKVCSDVRLCQEIRNPQVNDLTLCLEELEKEQKGP